MRRMKQKTDSNIFPRPKFTVIWDYPTKWPLNRIHNTSSKNKNSPLSIFSNPCNFETQRDTSEKHTKSKRQIFKRSINLNSLLAFFLSYLVSFQSYEGLKKLDCFWTASTMWVASPWGFSEMMIQPAWHESHSCCLLRAGFPAFQPVLDNTHCTRVEQVVSSFQKILRGSQLTCTSHLTLVSQKYKNSVNQNLQNT